MDDFINEFNEWIDEMKEYSYDKVYMELTVPVTKELIEKLESKVPSGYHIVCRNGRDKFNNLKIIIYVEHKKYAKILGAIYMKIYIIESKQSPLNQEYIIIKKKDINSINQLINLLNEKWGNKYLFKFDLNYMDKYNTLDFKDINIRITICQK
jgi:hypothetical protein